MRPDFTWKSSYSVGNAILDEQHKKLLGICAGIAESVDDQTIIGRGHYHAVLHELDIFAQTHFRTEEALLRQHHYPKLEEQEAEHHIFQDRLTEFMYEATIGRFNKIGLQTFLAEWWIHHIQHEDMQYSDFLSRRLPGHDHLFDAR